MLDSKEQAIQSAINQLFKSDRGRKALAGLSVFIDDAALGLDATNQDAILLLLGMAWGGAPQTVRDMIRIVTGQQCEHGVADYEYCEACSNEYKRAAREAGIE